jgi:hypothetical protein
MNAWKASSGKITSARGGIGSINLYQSQAEEQERPRKATHLPIDLNTYKYMGGEHAFPTQTGHAEYLLFSGPIQFSD